MLEGFYFVLVGVSVGLAYLARTKQQDFLSYGLGLLGVACFLSGVIVLVSGSDADGGGTDNVLVTILSLLRNVTLGGGVAFLIYLGSQVGLRYYKERKTQADVRLESIRLDTTRSETAREWVFLPVSTLRRFIQWPWPGTTSALPSRENFMLSPPLNASTSCSNLPV